MSDTRNLMSQLPPELILNFAQYLDRKSLGRLQQVCMQTYVTLAAEFSRPTSRLFPDSWNTIDVNLYLDKIFSSLMLTKIFDSSTLTKFTAEELMNNDAFIRNNTWLRKTNPQLIKCAYSCIYTFNFVEQQVEFFVDKEADEQEIGSGLNKEYLKRKFKLLFVYHMLNRPDYECLFAELYKHIQLTREKLLREITPFLVKKFGFTEQFLKHISNPDYYHRLYICSQGLTYFSYNTFRSQCYNLQKELLKDEKVVATLSTSIISAARQGLNAYKLGNGLFSSKFGLNRREGFQAFLLESSQTIQNKLLMIYLLLTEKNGKTLKLRVTQYLQVLAAVDLKSLRHLLIHNYGCNDQFLSLLSDNFKKIRHIDKQGAHHYPNFQEICDQLKAKAGLDNVAEKSTLPLRKS